MRTIKDLTTHMTGIHCSTQQEADAIGELLKEQGIPYNPHWFNNINDDIVLYTDGYASLTWSKDIAIIYPASDFLDESMVNVILNT